MEEKKQLIIAGVSEAFSMQPTGYSVDQVMYDGRKVKEIKLEAVYCTGDPFDYYVGYDENGDKIFECRKETMNVYYKKPTQ